MKSLFNEIIHDVITRLETAFDLGSSFIQALRFNASSLIIEWEEEMYEDNLDASAMHSRNGPFMKVFLRLVPERCKEKHIENCDKIITMLETYFDEMLTK